MELFTLKEDGTLPLNVNITKLSALLLESLVAYYNIHKHVLSD